MHIKSFNVNGAAKSIDYKVEKQTRVLINTQTPAFKSNDYSLQPNTGKNIQTSATLSSNVEVVKQLLEYMLGKKINVTENPLQSRTESGNNTELDKQATNPSFEISETSSLREQALFSKFEGSVSDDSGKVINLKLEEYVYKYEETTSIYAGPVKDPLVVSLDGGPLCQSRTIDGLPQFDNGGYVAFDKNGDGRIDEMTELLGQSSGNAFQDLVSLDSDGNYWVDSGDAAWCNLYLYTNGTASHLDKSGLGALYTGSLGTNFEDDAYYIKGKGIALYEDGKPASLSRIEIKT